MALQDRPKLLRSLARVAARAPNEVGTLAFVNQLEEELGGVVTKIEPPPATPATLNEVIALLQSYGLCALIFFTCVLPAAGAEFGDIPANLTLGASQSVRRNAGNSAFEAYTTGAGGGGPFSGLYTDLDFTGSNLTSILTRHFADLQSLPTTLAGYGITDAVPGTRTVNGHALSSNVTVTASDLSLVIGTNVEAWSANLDAWSGLAAASKLDSNSSISGATKTKITYDAKGLVTTGADATTADITDSTNKRYVTDANLIVIGNTSGTNTGDQTLAGLGGVPTSRSLTIGATAQDLSANRTWLANVTNDAQTKASIVPNTAPGAGQILVGNAGGTAYAPVTLSGSGATATISSGGVLTLSGLTLNTTGSAATLTTPRSIYGNNFDGSAGLTQVIASTYGGTGNGFTKFSGPATSEKTKTVRDANDTVLELGGSYTPTGTWTNLTLITPTLGTPASGTLTNCTFPTLNQNTTGSAATLTTTRSIHGGNFNGSADVTTGIPKTFILNGITNGNTARQSQVVVSGTAYYVTSSNLNLPATLKDGMIIGTKFVWRVHMDKTAAGTGTFQMIIYRGTNGTTSDTADVTQTIGTQTAVVDNMVVDVTLTVTTTGATGAYFWSICPIQRALTATGFGIPTGTTGLFTGTVSSVALNTASLIFGLGFKATTGTPTITVAMVQAQALNID